MEADHAAAEAWLAKIDNAQQALVVQMRRGVARPPEQIRARGRIRKAPEKSSDDARAKLLEAQILREANRGPRPTRSLDDANRRDAQRCRPALRGGRWSPRSSTAMDDMERLLRRVIDLQPDYHHAYNALGYSLAERNLRLRRRRR